MDSKERLPCGKGQETVPTDFMKAVFDTFDQFQNRECWALKWQEIAGQIDDYITSPLPDKRLEQEWQKIEAHTPIPLPEDYRELFCGFGCGEY